jgi:hypothetical protein
MPLRQLGLLLLVWLLLLLLLLLVWPLLLLLLLLVWLLLLLLLVWLLLHFVLLHVASLFGCSCKHGLLDCVIVLRASQGAAVQVVDLCMCRHIYRVCVYVCVLVWT